MMTFLDQWYQIEIGWIVWLQGGGQFAPFFRWFTDVALNSVPLIAAVVLFFVSWKNGCLLFVIYFLGHCVNMVFKMGFGTPRPYWLNDDVQALIGSGSFGLPSGHMLITACVWIGVAIMYPKRWVVGLAFLLIIMMAFSRVYLGVHFVVDVIAGITFAAILAWGCTRERFWNGYFNDGSMQKQLAFCFSILLIALATWLVWSFAEKREIPNGWPGNLTGMGSLASVFNGLVGLLGVRIGVGMLSRNPELLRGMSIITRLGGFTYAVTVYFLTRELTSEFLSSTSGWLGLLGRSLKYGVSAWVASYLAILIFSGRQLRRIPPNTTD